MDKHTFESILAVMPGHVYWKDTQCVLQGCNNALATLLGLNSPDEIVGKTDYDLATKEEAEAIRAFDFHVMQIGQEQAKEETYALPNGEKAVYLSRKSPIFNEQGKVIGIIGVSLDITAKKNEEQLKLEKKLAEEKIEYTKMAAGSIAHDLRSPLASISAGMGGIGSVLGDLLKAYAAAKEAELTIPLLNARKLSALKQVIERCKSEIAFSNGYINMILNNLQHDSIDTSQYKKLRIKAVLESVLDSYPYQEKERELVHCDLAVDFEIWGSNIYIKNMFNNLLKNSFHYIMAYNRGEIYISTTETEEHSIIKFKDTAKGAPPEVTEHMFDGYFSKRNGGTGLGLAFCKAVMESFGGSISVESIQEEFLEFTLKFPKIALSKD